MKSYHTAKDCSLIVLPLVVIGNKNQEYSVGTTMEIGVGADCSEQ